MADDNYLILRIIQQAKYTMKLFLSNDGSLFDIYAPDGYDNLGDFTFDTLHQPPLPVVAPTFPAGSAVFIFVTVLKYEKKRK